MHKPTGLLYWGYYSLNIKSMISPEQKTALATFMASHPTAVIATADASGAPAAAVVLFANDDELQVIFGTHPSRKFQNLQANPRAAFVLTKDWQQIQLHGPVQQLAGGEAETAAALFAQKHPEMDKQLLAGTVFFRLTPAWIRFMNTAKQPPEQWEVALTE